MDAGDGFETQRRKNIEERKKLLASLNIPQLKNDVAEAIKSEKAKKPVKKRPPPKVINLSPSRRSDRLRKVAEERGPVKYYFDEERPSKAKKPSSSSESSESSASSSSSSSFSSRSSSSSRRRSVRPLKIENPSRQSDRLRKLVEEHGPVKYCDDDGDDDQIEIKTNEIETNQSKPNGRNGKTSDAPKIEEEEGLSDDESEEDGD